MQHTRRRFLGSAAAAAALSTLSSSKARASGGSSRRFLFVHAEGGWDPLCVFAPLFGNANIDMEAEAEPFTIGGLHLVDHPRRPQVRRFFEAHHEQCLVINGVSTRSVNHEVCAVVANTGATNEDRSDWATLLADAEADAFELPHLVVNGPVFAGSRQVIVSRAEGRLQQVIDGSLLQQQQTPTRSRLSDPASHVVDRFLRQRASALSTSTAPVHRDYVEAAARAEAIRSRRYEVNLTSGGSLRERAHTAITALADGVCRCASISTGFAWDTHVDITQQEALWDGLFGELAAIVEQLKQTRGPEGRPLADDVVVVVLSEMARTPAFNDTNGRDHWPFTSMLLLGPGLTGSREIGGYTELYNGIGVDAASAEPDASKPGIAADEVGATLLALADIDPASALRNVRPIEGVLQ